MKKNMYLWILIAVAVILCGIFLVMFKNVSNNTDSNSLNNISRSKLESKNNDAKNSAEQEKVDLVQTNLDFEEDADDLSDSFVDDAQFDESASFDAIENEVY